MGGGGGGQISFGDLDSRGAASTSRTGLVCQSWYHSYLVFVSHLGTSWELLLFSKCSTVPCDGGLCNGGVGHRQNVSSKSQSFWYCQMDEEIRPFCCWISSITQDQMAMWTKKHQEPAELRILCTCWGCSSSSFQEIDTEHKCAPGKNMEKTTGFGVRLSEGAVRG